LRAMRRQLQLRSRAGESRTGSARLMLITWI
jgi:hypothetical protein